jgi:hypothetical protein
MFRKFALFYKRNSDAGLRQMDGRGKSRQAAANDDDILPHCTKLSKGARQKVI